jgi:hypothetical protein
MGWVRNDLAHFLSLVCFNLLWNELFLTGLLILKIVNKFQVILFGFN